MMIWRNTPETYGIIARVFHWLTLAMLLGSFSLALSMVPLPLSPRKLELYSWHKWLGVTIFLIVALRLAWRLYTPPPPLPPDLSALQHRLAKASHAALYLLLFAIPLTGWIMSSALNLPVYYLGLFEIPSPFGVDEQLGKRLLVVHGYLAWTLAALVCIHVAAALQHHIYLKDDVLRRMLPWPSRAAPDQPPADP